MAGESIQHVSDTAFWVAHYRAIESDRRDRLFDDSLAKVLVGEEGRKIAESMSATARYSYWTLVVRTCLIDRLILMLLSRKCRMIINIGAGLDTRPYRLDLPADIHWIEVDFPHVIEMKNQKLSQQKPKCHLERIPVDLSNPQERRRVLQELNSHDHTAVVLTEGVIPYFSEQMVADFAYDLHQQKNVKYWIADYFSPQVYPRFQSRSFQKKLGSAPFLFFPKDWFGFFAERGWRAKEVFYLYDEGERLGRPFPLPWFAKIIKFFAAQKQFEQQLRLTGFSVFEKIL